MCLIFAFCIIREFINYRFCSELAYVILDLFTFRKKQLILQLFYKYLPVTFSIFLILFEQEGIY